MTWNVELNENHLDEGLARLLIQYNKAVNLQKIISIKVERIQQLEYYLYKFFGILNLKKATGIFLDLLGDLVGQERFNFNDDIYRLLIVARIAINTSGGTPENIINIFKLITNFSKIEYNEFYPCGVQIQCSGDLNINRNLLKYIIKTIDDALPAGVSIDYISEFDVNSSWTCAEEDNILSSSEGCGDEDEPTVGGALSEEIYTGFILY